MYPYGLIGKEEEGYSRTMLNGLESQFRKLHRKVKVRKKADSLITSEGSFNIMLHEHLCQRKLLLIAVNQKQQ